MCPAALGKDAITAAGGIKNWKRGELLGSGSYGKVYAALDLNSGTQIAVKQVRFHGDSRRKSREVDALQREIELLQGLDHANIVKYLGACDVTRVEKKNNGPCHRHRPVFLVSQAHTATSPSFTFSWSTRLAAP